MLTFYLYHLHLSLFLLGFLPTLFADIRILRATFLPHLILHDLITVVIPNEDGRAVTLTQTTVLSVPSNSLFTKGTTVG
jgi:hypothetical protein